MDKGNKIIVKYHKVKMEKEKLFSWDENPYLADFVREFGKPYNPETDSYNPSIYMEDIKSGKNDPIYNVHMYWTKVPPKGIAKLIEHFTSPGDIVLDPFCGSGMTGVAALLTGRNAILIDLSPSATFIAKNYTTPINPEEFKKAVSEIRERVREEMEWLYETKCRRCGDSAQIIYTIWSDVYRCPICETEMRFWDVAVRGAEVLKSWECPRCSVELNKQRAVLVRTEPVSVNYKCPRCGRREDEVDEFDLKRLEEIEEREIPYWYPRNEFPMGYNTRQPMARGIRRVDQFFTKRNLWALARLWEEAGAFSKGVEDKLKFIITSFSIMMGSKATRYHATDWAKKILHGTLYVPSLQTEWNLEYIFSRKSKSISESFNSSSPKGTVIISTQSATDLSRIPDSSIDYCFTDPPYGANINYSELNFVWEAWLGHFTKIEEEAIINPFQKKGVKEYQELMEKAFKEVFRVLKPGRFLSLTFHNSRTEIWNAIQTALKNTGFEISYIGVFDKMQRTFKQVTTDGAVGYDVLVHAYKPGISNHIKKEVEKRIEIDEVIDWLEERLRKLPVTKNEEREARRLHSEFIGWCLSQGISLAELVRKGLKDFGESFLNLLKEYFQEIDGYYFLPGQFPKMAQGSLSGEFATITDETSALNWLMKLLQEPKSYSEIHPLFLQALGSTKLKRSLEDLLDENFVNEEGKWRAPTEEELDEWEKIKRLKQVKKFESWWRKFKAGEEKNLPPEEIMVQGLKEWYRRGSYWWMVEVKEILRRKGLWSNTPYKARNLLEMAEEEIKNNA